MLKRLFPSPLDNNYRGRRIALWVFPLMTAMTIGRSLAHMLLEDGGAGQIASVPLADYPEPAANALVTLFGLWGLSQLLMGLFYAIVFLRYRALIPLMYLFFTLEYVMRLAAPLYTPGLVTTHTAPGAIGNLIFVPLGLALLVLSLRQPAAKKS